MKQIDGGRPFSPAAEAGAVAVMVALLIAVQYAFSWVAGVEVVTVMLLCFCWSFGMRAGLLAATAFSLLRCIVFGFYPSVIVLYLIYYPSFAAAFAAIGKAWRRRGGLSLVALVVLNVVLAALAVGCGVCAATQIIKVSRLAKAMVKTLLWVICALCAALIIFTDVLYALTRRAKARGKKLCADNDNSESEVCTNAYLRRVQKFYAAAYCASIAAVFTVAFTLLDDLITPLFMGWGLFSVSSASYFYSSFIVLAPHTVCAIVSVMLLFLPVTAVTDRFARR